MFEAAELGSKVSRQELEAQLPQLRVGLVNAQYDLREADFPVLVVVVGDDRPGVSALVNRLNEWMDARFVRTRVFVAPSDEEQWRPRFWRYWRELPGRGELGLYTGEFALETITARLRGEIDDVELDRRLGHMERFERALRDDGALVLKFWVHVPKKEFKRRVKKARKKGDEAPRLDDTDQGLFEAYDQLLPVAEHVLRKTDPAGGSWHIVEGTDARHRDLTVARTILAALSERLSRPPAPAPVAAGGTSATPHDGVLDAVDLTARLERPAYRKQRDALQGRLRELSLIAREKGVSSVVLFEGWDAAGKGGVIRRITRAMDVQDYRIVAIAAPTDEELAHHYLWRFWRQLPRAGRMLIFDRSWYGRVLVERVERLTPELAWQRAYAEINDFEEQIVERGVPLFKFWLHVDPEEQLRRFRERESTPYKKYKITDEDYRNRERREAYAAAVNEMVQRTSTELARWHLVPANDKRFARVEVLRVLGEGLAKRLGGKSGGK